nr:dimethylsulfoxide reductase, chain B [Shigella sonnei]
MTTQYGFFIDSSRCTGCKTCELACKDYKDLTPEVSFRRIYEYAGGDWQEDNGVWHQNVFAYYLSISCNHCEDPACTKVCPSGAMHKREDGFVVVDEDVCIGCRYCHMACPYGAPQYNETKGHMTKCDGCYDRVAEGKKPICVESCPLRALDFGPIDELRKKHGDLAAVAPLPRAHFTKPNIVIKPNANSRPTGDTTGYLAVGGIGWLLAMLKKLSPALRTLWLVVTMVLGVVFVWMMVRVYNSIDTVPTWYSIWTPMGFFLTMFMGGPLLGYLLLSLAGVDSWAMRLLPAISVLALVVSGVVSVMQGAELATIHSSVQQAAALVPDYGALMSWRIVLLAVALCLWIAPQLKGYQPAVPLLSVSFILLLAGELIGRGVFYGLHMTVGMAVAS